MISISELLGVICGLNLSSFYDSFWAVAGTNTMTMDILEKDSGSSLYTQNKLLRDLF